MVEPRLHIRRRPLLAAFENQRPHPAALLALLLERVVDIALRRIELQQNDPAVLRLDFETLRRVIGEIVFQVLARLQSDGHARSSSAPSCVPVFGTSAPASWPSRTSCS